MFRDDAHEKNERGELRFDEEGNLLENNEKGPNHIEESPTMSSALRPLLEYMDEYRRRVAAPEDTLVRKKYSKYTDLSYIKNRLGKVEDDIHRTLWRNNQINVDYVNGEYAQMGPHFRGEGITGRYTSESKNNNNGMFPSLLGGQNSMQNLN